MLSMVSGSVGFAPNPLDGLTFIFEPLRPLAATIVEDAESPQRAGGAARRSTRSPLCCCVEPSSCRSPAGSAKQPMKKYGVRV